jgi:hypothetical protein
MARVRSGAAAAAAATEAKACAVCQISVEKDHNSQLCVHCNKAS